MFMWYGGKATQYNTALEILTGTHSQYNAIECKTTIYSFKNYKYKL